MYGCIYTTVNLPQRLNCNNLENLLIVCILPTDAHSVDN